VMSQSTAPVFAFLLLIVTHGLILGERFAWLTARAALMMKLTSLAISATSSATINETQQSHHNLGPMYGMLAVNPPSTGMACPFT